MLKVDLPEMKNGLYRIEKFEVKKDLYGMLHGREVTPGIYTRLMRGNTVVMSDTPSEMSDHRMPVIKAKGSCLINGLGIGMVLKNILIKPEVTDVTVVELSQEVIEMVASHYNDPRVKMVCANALEYKPEKGKLFQMVWHDIWDDITSDNIPDMEKLHRKYARKTSWQGSWCKDKCLYCRNKEKRYSNL